MPDSRAGIPRSAHGTARREGSPPEILIVGCCYYLDPATFISRLNRYAARAGFLLRGVVVDNVARPAPAQISGITVIHGTNETFDYSGFFEGLKTLEAAVGEDPLPGVLFVNDTLVTKHHGALVFRMTAALCRFAQQLQCPSIVGLASRYSFICGTNPWSRLDRYVSSFCFFLNRDGLRILKQLPQHAIAEGVAGLHAIDEPEWGLGLDPPFREMIRGHVLYEHSPTSWPQLRSENLSPDVVVRKARCAYFEHRLSGGIGSEGAILPINAGGYAATKLFIGERWASLLRLV